MRLLISLTAAALLLLTLGCSEQSTEPAPTEKAGPIGGETPGEITALLETNTPTNLEMAPAGDPNWVAWPPFDVIKNSDVYAVTFLWGQLTNSVLPGMPVTDWSGRLWVNGVAVVQPRRTINFEPGQDSIVMEDEPAMAAWVSETAVDYDGICFLVFLRRDITYIVAPWLTFSTTPIELRFDFHQLVKLDTFLTLPQGNAVAVHARRIWPDRCPGGFLEGRWIKDDNTGASGRIEGLWLNYRGEPEGIITGQFWTNNDGTREYSGWVSGYMLTVIIAEFKGHWWYDDPRMCPLCGSGHGWFRGNFHFAFGDNRGGAMFGEFGDFNAPDPSSLSMPFMGVWREFCPWTPETPGTNNDIGGPN
ncbi:MAG: hypothetical protein AB1772_11605 [Candidatus Zixiibacteriota bacterium]